MALPAYLAIAVMTRKQSGKVYECVELTPDSRIEILKMAVGLVLHRWVVERTFAWLNQFRRLRVRYEAIRHPRRISAGTSWSKIG